MVGKVILELSAKPVDELLIRKYVVSMVKDSLKILGILWGDPSVPVRPPGSSITSIAIG